MRSRLAVVFCSLVVIVATNLVFIPSSESSLPKTNFAEPKEPELTSVLDLVQGRPFLYALDSVEFEERGKPATPEKLAELKANRDKKLKENAERQRRMGIPAK